GDRKRTHTRECQPHEYTSRTNANVKRETNSWGDPFSVAAYARGGGPSGLGTKLMKLVMWWSGDVAIAGGVRRAGAVTSTAIGPRTEMTFAASGSVELLHSEPRFCGAG